MTNKSSNPKNVLGVRKAPMSAVPANVLAEIGVGMLEGACKHGRHNFRVAGVRASVYYDATMRHVMDWWEGEDIDPDSHLSHITKAITSLVVLRDAMLQDKLTDDRPPKSKEFYPRLNEQAGQIIDKHAGTPPTHYTQSTTELDRTMGGKIVQFRQAVEQKHAGESPRGVDMGGVFSEAQQKSPTELWVAAAENICRNSEKNPKYVYTPREVEQAVKAGIDEFKRQSPPEDIRTFKVIGEDRCTIKELYQILGRCEKEIVRRQEIPPSELYSSLRQAHQTTQHPDNPPPDCVDPFISSP